MWKDSETDIDYLNIQYIIEMIKSIVKDEKLSPATIGVYGDWGSGKSSIIEMSLLNFLDDKDIVTVKFNGWLFEGYDDAKTVLLSSILDELVKHTKLTEELKNIASGLYKSIDKIKLAKSITKFGTDFLLTGGVLTASQLTVSQVKNILGIANEKDISDDKIQKTLDSIKNERNLDDFRKDINDFRENFDTLVRKTKIKKIVVYIDELDRCNPDTILETLEAIRLFVFVEKIYFIIGADERHIQYSVQRKFSNIEGNQINIGKEYLEKIVQYPINIPRMRTSDVEFYLLSLLCEKNIEKVSLNEFLNDLRVEKKRNPLSFSITKFLVSTKKYGDNVKIKEAAKLARNLAPILSRELNGNPRQCKRFLNMLVMRQEMAKYNDQSLNLLILSKVMLLEYFKPEVFDLLMDSVINGNRKIWNDISNAERNSKYEIENPILRKLKESVWGEAWFSLEPSLGDEDLEVYFYYSREKNKGKDDLTTFKLSPIAKKVFDILDIQNHNYKEEIRKINEGISVSDQEEVLEAFYNKHIDKKESVEANKFEALLFYGTLDLALFPSLKNLLNILSVQTLTRSSAPFIADLIQVTGDKELITIVERWKTENPTLVKAIELLEEE